MIWVVLLIIAILAYFIFQGLHARHISRCHTDNRTAEHIPDSIAAPKAHTEFHKQSAQTAAQVQRQRIRDPQNTPSLLYADPNRVANRNQQGLQNQQAHSDVAMSDATQQKTSAPSGNTQCTTDDVIDMDLETSDPTADHTLEFTAEHEPMGDVGIPAGNNQYDEANVSQNNNNAGYVAAGAAAAAGIAAAAPNNADATDEKFKDEYDDEYATNNTYNTQNEYSVQESTLEREGTLERPPSYIESTTEDIDVELGGAGSYDDDESDGNDHDELLDFGDLTSDISDMLKELNLRETDSPRLEINKAEFEQLKTGEPGEVKPAKIENVADKLRNMLQ